MVQSFTVIAATDTLENSRVPIHDNVRTALSQSSGTAFPTQNLEIGMPCYRSDLKILYLLESTGPDTWVEFFDFNKTLLQEEDADLLYVALTDGAAGVDFDNGSNGFAATDVQGLGADAADAGAAWPDAPAEPLALADHLEDRGVALADAVRTLRAAATVKLVGLQDLWKPVATRLAAWLEGARAVAEAEPRRGFLKEAEDWLKGIEGELRDARFQPIASKAQEIWNTLRQSSSVDLTQVRLAGNANRRKLELDVSIDGSEGVALGVMSQGELNALALSLFLPRMLLDDSPFRFAVIDDPIQSMDPNKVDGLAQVLGDAAQTRQIVVLTHDPRLAEALRRLRIDATVLNVARRGESVVEVTESLDPVNRHLHAAWRLVREEDKLGDKLAGRVVPGLCRMAVEAACHQAVRRRRLARGDTHEAVEEALAEARTTFNLVTLALFDDATRHNDTYPRLVNTHGDWAPDLLRTLSKGTHQGWTRDLDRLVARTRTVADGLRA